MSSSKRINLAILAYLDAQRAALPLASAEEVEMALDALEGALRCKRSEAAAAGVTAGTLAAWESSASPAASAASAAAAAAPAAAAAAPAAPASHDDAAADEQAERLKEDGNAALKAGRYAHAEELYSEAIDASPAGKSSHIYFACVEGRRPAPLARSAQQPSASERAPPTPPPPHAHPCSNRAAVRLHLKNYEGCAEDAREAVRLNEGYAKAWIRLGQALHKLGRHAEGAEAYEAAERLEPDNKAAAVGRAECLKALGGGGGSGSGGGSSGSGSSSGGGGGGAVSGRSPRAAAPPAGGFDPAALAGLMGGAGGGDPMANPMVQGLMANVAKDPSLAASMRDPEVMACVCCSAVRARARAGKSPPPL